MSTRDDIDDTEDDGGLQAMAAEYALGLLSDEDRKTFESALAADPALEQDLAAWTEYFSTFTDGLPEQAPPPQLWRRIEAQAYGEARAKPLWRLLLPYLGGAVLGSALTWAVINSDMLDPDAGTHLYADLVAQEQGLVLLAHWAPDSGTFMLRRDAGAFPTDSALEIWLIPSPGAAPISVGLMAEAGLTQIAVPAALIPAMTPGATVALSREPLGGSPTGAPTGPILATGPLAIRS